jgi:Skp family chaperone for outer membrane proteins
MSRFLPVLLIFNTVLLFGAIIYFVIYFKEQSPKFAYINLGEVYNSFELKKEFEAKLKNETQMHKLLLDSLGIKVQMMEREFKTTKNGDKNRLSDLQTKEQEYLAKRKEFLAQDDELTKEYDGQIWKQINQYVNDYGEKYHYSFIMGTSGSGNLMHADKSFDITDKVTLYVNNRYKGNTD